MLGTGITLVEKVWCLLLGRVICGFARGFFNIAVTRFQEEYIPPHLYSMLGPTFAVSCTVGSYVATISGLLLPPDTSSEKTLEHVTIWRYIFGFPLVPLVIALLVHFILIKHEPPKFYLMRDEDEKAEQVIKQIYHTETDDDAKLIS